MLIRGFPREAAVSVDIGGVRTNFRMPDVLAIGLGGGSLVRDGRRAHRPGLGRLRAHQSKALVFGGDVLTTTDIVVAAGLEDIGDRSRVKHLRQGHDRDRARHDPSHGRHGGRSHEDQRRAAAGDPGRRRRDPGFARSANGFDRRASRRIPPWPTRSAPQWRRSAAKSTGCSPSKGRRATRCSTSPSARRPTAAIAAGAQQGFGQDRRRRGRAARLSAGQCHPHSGQGGRRSRRCARRAQVGEPACGR